MTLLVKMEEMKKYKNAEVRDSVCRDKGAGDSERIDQVEMKYI